MSALEPVGVCSLCHQHVSRRFEAGPLIEKVFQHGQWKVHRHKKAYELVPSAAAESSRVAS